MATGQRDALLASMRLLEAQRRHASAPERHKIFATQDRRRKFIEKAIQDRAQNTKTDFFAKAGAFINSKVACSLSSHKGEWFYTDMDHCSSSMVCERCARIFTDIKHLWQEPQRIFDDRCEFIQFCSRCGEEKTYLNHEWKWVYSTANQCEEYQECSWCHEKNSDKRVSHQWGQWSESGFVNESVRTCERCSEKEYKDNEMNPIPHVSQPEFQSRSNAQIDALTSNRSVPNIFGGWVGSNGLLYQISQTGGQFKIQGSIPASQIVVFNGQGNITGNTVQFAYTFTDGLRYDIGSANLWISQSGKEMYGHVNSNFWGNTRFILTKYPY